MRELANDLNESGEDRQVHHALKHPEVPPKVTTVQTLVGRVRASTAFTTKARSTRRDYARVLKQIEEALGDMPIQALSAPGTRAVFKVRRDSHHDCW